MFAEAVSCSQRRTVVLTVGVGTAIHTLGSTKGQSYLYSDIKILFVVFTLNCSGVSSGIFHCTFGTVV